MTNLDKIKQIKLFRSIEQSKSELSHIIIKEYSSKFPSDTTLKDMGNTISLFFQNKYGLDTDVVIKYNEERANLDFDIKIKK